jgi:DNA modification methylase
MSVQILNCDVMDGLRKLKDESVHCVVSSPPYWKLRDYGVDGQIGLEATPEDFIARLVEVFREVRRVLREDGTLWLNLGDSYAGSWGAQSRGDDYPSSSLQGSSTMTARQVACAPKTGGSKGVTGLKPKDLIGMPWRVALALQADGWWLRRDIIWSKPNPMPESVLDRPTTAHEYLFLLTKSADYYYDGEAIKERAEYGQPNSPDSIASPHGQGWTRRAAVPSGWDQGDGSHGSIHREGRNNRIGAKGNANGFRGGSYVHGEPGERTSAGNTKLRGLTPRHEGHVNHTGIEDTPRARDGGEGFSRNKRSVWEMATVPFDGEFCTSCRSFFDGPDKKRIKVEILELEGGRQAKRKTCPCGCDDAWLSHFATFPPLLPETCIKAGCPRGGTVLDPFGGAGTTGLVADRLQRHAVLIEINPDYAEMARLRIDAPRGALLELMEDAASC